MSSRELAGRIGVRIRQLRSDRRMTQVQLAKAVGVEFQQIQKYEYGTNCPTILMAERIAAVFGISPSDLCGWTDA